jgi:hypothetical protein
VPPPPVLGGGAHSLTREGLGDEGTYIVVFFVYTYFVGAVLVVCPERVIAFSLYKNTSTINGEKTVVNL